ncbi:hypothetical protein AB8S94_26710 [Klebsiella quasipneumoniae]|nr:hypothetical protein [Klebsiella quasipneumoniae]MCL6727144.1 hypothetical protein [Klebsiella quasipneumoniae]
MFGTIVGWGAGLVLGAIAGGVYGSFYGVDKMNEIVLQIIDAATSGSWVA